MKKGNEVSTGRESSTDEFTKTAVLGGTMGGSWLERRINMGRGGTQGWKCSGKVSFRLS